MKKAIDTNILVRYLTNDDPELAARAYAIIENDAVYLSLTVLLETEWVLRTSYKLPPHTICRLFRLFAGLPSVTIENASLLAQALALTEQGMDFADSLHLVSAEPCETFFTFDKAFIKAGRKAGNRKVQEP